MGAFGIFILVLSIIYAIYYIAMISMDLRVVNHAGSKGEVEVIAVSPSEHEVEKPVEVNEEDYMRTQSESKEEEEVLTAEEIANMQTEELYKESQNAKGEMQSIRTNAQAEYLLTEEKDELSAVFEANLENAGEWNNEED